ncbi:hypothetical protein GCM10007972_06310 [Iodidimonas muriae]|uniref:DUF2059 domain-containing protein n=1 Tax=Iodidimonas muriae TaxID=261467 RepID=A0ABQ2LBA2_9PROT|nr:DUF2059 domain-containing protein [Iodidimonas muriae]GER05866.1 hypothetical protein JCM17843_01760 [Kordiimonadales bacterium JCM 17843]GGO07197.1 hypothetical protein GCM10007972_06310 [Iodidimonas muriae]
MFRLSLSPLHAVRSFSFAAVFAGLCLAAPASAQEDEEKTAAIRELVEITQVEAMADQMIGLFNEDILPMLLEANPDQSEKLRTIVREEVTATMNDMKPAVVALTASVWSRHFSTQEIRELTAFYKTPLGIKLLEKQPVIARESMQAGMQMSQQAAMTAMEHIKQRLTAESLSIPAPL